MTLCTVTVKIEAGWQTVVRVNTFNIRNTQVH